MYEVEEIALVDRWYEKLSATLGVTPDELDQIFDEIRPVRDARGELIGRVLHFLPDAPAPIAGKVATLLPGGRAALLPAED